MEFQNSYLDLGEGFYQTADPEPVRSPELFLWNHGLAQSLNIAAVNDADESVRAQFFSGNAKLPGARPIALAYAGHQFGHFNPQLGDGRAHLLGDVSDGTFPGQDIQLKGSGKTAFSRGGDGRCALGPAIREFVMSEAMAALGVPTTRCLAVVTTGETVYRETPLPGAVVTRVAASHLRVGSFEYFAARNQYDSVRKLCDYAIRKHYPELDDLEGAERYLAFLAAAVEKQVRLVCEWMRVGFIHGVMNTDNTAISGETIDFGPCAMMGAYSPNTVFSSIDTQGRYRFGHQPNIAQWNLARLAETLIPLVDDDGNRAIEKITPIVMAYTDQFQQAYWNMIAQKYGLRECTEDDIALLTGG
ncbi:MAG: YdiU family protein, partial [Pseudomonadales bacterium]|nr:YdiU family protein [Pseudomonadales bacterium]